MLATDLDLYAIDRQQGNVEMTLDHRLLSQDGRKAIREDFKRTEILGGSIADVATKESVSLLGDRVEGRTGLFEHIDTEQKVFSATKEFATDPANAAYAAALSNPDATAQEKQAAYTALGNHLSAQLGLSPVQVQLILNDTYRGAFSPQTPDTLYLSDNRLTGSGDAVNVLGHEFSHRRDYLNDTGITPGAAYKGNREEYAGVMGAAAEDHLGFQYSLHNYAPLAATNHRVDTRLDDLTTLDLGVIRNSGEFSRLDPRQIDGSFYVYRGKVVAYDQLDNDKVKTLDDRSFGAMVAGEARKGRPALLLSEIAQIGDPENAPPARVGAEWLTETGGRVYDLTERDDFETLKRQTDMGYYEPSGQARVFFQNGVNTEEDRAHEAAARLERFLGIPAGYILNDTHGIPKDIYEDYRPDAFGLKDVLNEYVYRDLNARGEPILITTHSAGNKDYLKALGVGALHGHRYPNLSFFSIGSPVGEAKLAEASQAAGIGFLGQDNDWRDPVTHPALWVAGTATLAVGGLAAGVTLAPVTGGGSLYGYFSALIGGGIGGGIGVGALTTYHPAEHYFDRSKTRAPLEQWRETHYRTRPQSGARR